MGLLPIRVLALGAVATALQGLVSPQTHLRRARVPQALLTPSEFYAISPPVFSFPAPAPAEATSLSMPLTLLAEDIFGSVFAAGMSIAFATIGTTILLAFIVRARYDEIEDRYFENQDRASEEAIASQTAVENKDLQEVEDFFSDSTPSKK